MAHAEGHVRRWSLALRHTCGAWAALGGAHPKAVQTLMRHSAITLTMDTYGHLFPRDDDGKALELAAAQLLS